MKSQPCIPPCRTSCLLWNENMTLVRCKAIVFCKECIERFSSSRNVFIFIFLFYLPSAYHNRPRCLHQHRYAPVTAWDYKAQRNARSCDPVRRPTELLRECCETPCWAAAKASRNTSLSYCESAARRPTELLRERRKTPHWAAARAPQDAPLSCCESAARRPAELL
jgi:hypothetical protein